MRDVRAFSPLFFLPGILCLLLTVSAPCQETPKTMVKLSMRLIEPAPETGSFAAQPRTLWRAGKKYARIAEAPDLENHVHGLTILNEPDAWMINLTDKSGKHMVDSGPSLEVHLPIFPTPSNVKMKLRELEFGNELEFFASNGATVSPGDAIKGKSTERHELTMSGRKLILWTDAASKKPVRMSMTFNGQTQTFEYVSYEDGLPFDPSLFRPPAGITLADAQ
jgi:hypothetical protein